VKKLDKQELQESLLELPLWKLEAGELVREWKFRDFPAAIAFVTAVANRAEAAGHHPNIDIRYNHVRLALVTHDAGGITLKDLEMAAALDKI
jgi:4a-hydroxytetrahydrobiopterin dehydratase